MSKSLRTRILVTLGVLAAALFFSFPLEKRINLGLDLKGGMHLVLRVETEKLEPNARQDAVARAIEILRNRIDGLGVGETVIQRQGDDQILVQLPGITDRERALRVVGQVAQLEFSLVNSDPMLLKDALAGKVPAGYLLKNIKGDNEPVLIDANSALKGEAIQDARVDFNSSGFGEPVISFTLNPKGTKEFGDLTRRHTGERLAIMLDGEVLSAPNIREPILSGRGEISGTFTMDEASLLALALRSGSLPAPMHVEEERTIGPLLGKDSIRAGVTASVVGALAVFIFMIGYYFLSGIIADLALMMNFFMILGIMGMLKTLLPESQVTMTLPGIAGIILTLGMAVDANVLINERIREEINNGRTLSAAVTAGFNRAFTAIFDSNFTTLIAAFMLFQFGSGPIKGFAVTLSIGLICSMFTAIYVSKTIFLFLLEKKWIKSLRMVHLFRNSKINFIGQRYLFLVLSVVAIVVSLGAVMQKGDAAYGIDFAGGQIQEYRFAQPVDAQRLRDLFKKNGVNDAIIQQFDQHPENVVIRTSEDTYEQVNKILKEEMPDNSFENLRVEKVGPVVGKLLRMRALWAMILALGGILLYVGFRFKHFDFAVAGVFALLHDVSVALIIVMMGRQIDLLVVTALLTIAGYSINDTIVTYDRIRENMPKMRKVPLSEIINVSINQTFGRTILTTSVTLMVVLALYLFGGEVLNTFALCLLIGFLTGAYSTIFIASPLVLVWQKLAGSGKTS